MSSGGQIFPRRFHGIPKCQAFAWAMGSPMQGPRERKEEKREDEGVYEEGGRKRKTEIDELDVKQDTDGGARKKKESKEYQANVLEGNLKSGDGTVELYIFFLSKG